MSASLAGAPRGFSADAAHSATLPASYYFDPAIAERERETIWFRTWQLVGYLHQLSQPGAYLTADILDQKIFVIRGKDGELRAFYNVCMHRGHLLLEGEGTRSVITCPFHAWTYDLRGALKAAGNAENVEGFDPADFALTPLRVEILAHMVFVNLDPGAVPLREQAPGLESDILATVPDLMQLKLARRDPFAVRANWKFVLDGLECYHCPIIHPEATRAVDFTLRELSETGIWQRHRTPLTATAAAGDQTAAASYGAGKDAAVGASNIWYLWPNLVCAAHWGRSNFKVMRTWPVDIDNSAQTIDNFCADPPSAGDISGMDRFRDLVQPQDIGAMEKQQLAIRSRGYRQGRLMVDTARSWRSEHPTHHFQRLVWQALHGADAPMHS